MKLRLFFTFAMGVAFGRTFDDLLEANVGTIEWVVMLVMCLLMLVYTAYYNFDRSGDKDIGTVTTLRCHGGKIQLERDRSSQ